MGQRLVGKVAVVTGGGNGVGRCISVDMAREGARLVVADIDEAAAARVAEKIRQSRGSALAVGANVAFMKDGRDMIETAIREFGRIDILVCSAGICVTKGVEETTEKEWDDTMAVHLKGHFSCISHAVPHMKRQKSGRIITVSSRGGFGWGGATYTAYSAAKAGILGLTAILAKELGPHGITVNSLLPSAITRLFPWDRAPSGDGIPAEAHPSPESVSPMAVYLATDEADYINGQFLYASGGNIALFPSFPKVTMLLRKKGLWSVDELSEVLPTSLAGIVVNPSAVKK